jgi:hypothetical protein
MDETASYPYATHLDIRYPALELMTFPIWSPPVPTGGTTKPSVR